MALFACISHASTLVATCWNANARIDSDLVPAFLCDLTKIVLRIFATHKLEAAATQDLVSASVVNQSLLHQALHCLITALSHVAHTAVSSDSMPTLLRTRIGRYESIFSLVAKLGATQPRSSVNIVSLSFLVPPPW